MAREDYEIKAIGEPTHEELDWLGRLELRLRKFDRRELAAAAGNAWAAIVESLLASEEAYRITGAKGEPLVLYGKCSEEGIPGRLIWCMATEDLAPYEREFARVSKKILRAWVEEYGILWNAVGDSNEPAKRWLKWCGAEFGEPMAMGGEIFVRFYIRGE